jgi:hypothetical protein
VSLIRLGCSPLTPGLQQRQQSARLPGSAAAVIARTTATRCAPAACTAARSVASMPPMAKKGIGLAAAAWRT